MTCTSWNAISTVMLLFFSKMPKKKTNGLALAIVQALGDMLSRKGELAPIKLDEAMQYYGFNPTRIVDVVDEEKSTIAYFSDGGLMDIDHYVLRPDVKELPPIFRIPQLVENTTYVSDEFIARVNECKLSGFRFQPLP